MTKSERIVVLRCALSAGGSNLTSYGRDTRNTLRRYAEIACQIRLFLDDASVAAV